jgi:preprotein translocase subunit SecG
MVQLIWTFSAMALIFIIMIQNPTSQGMAGQNQFFASTRSTEATLNKITWTLIGTFLSLTTYLAIYSKID